MQVNNKSKREYLYSLFQDGNDCQQMQDLKAKYPDISIMTVHILYCKDILDWASCMNCANFSNNKKEHAAGSKKELDTTIDDWMYGE